MSKSKKRTPAVFAHSNTLFIFSFSLFTSAALMFAVQPLAGKMLLPLVGGSTSGWVVAMAFFQIALLAGYALAHLLSRLEARLHGIALALLLLCGLAVLPVSITEKWHTLDSQNLPSLKVMSVLLLATGLPFLGLSVASPTLQRLFSVSGHAQSHDPYFLYAASNAGSFIGLFSYPLILEPLFGLKTQALVWQGGYIALIALTVACLLLARQPAKEKAKPAAAKKADKPADLRKQRLSWLALSFIPSSLMLGVTTHITTDVASAPLIWAIPLALYLLTHIIAFARKRIISPGFVNTFQPVAVGVIVVWSISGAELKNWIFMLLHLPTFWLCAQMCHMRLADSRPAAHRLTEFYLFIALGGALGGSFNAFIAPFIFSLPLEYPIMLILCCALHPEFKTKIPKKIQSLFMPFLALAAAALVAANMIAEPMAIAVLMLVVTLSVVITMQHVRTLFYTLALLLAISQTVSGHENLLYSERNFFGILKVVEIQKEGMSTRYIFHGTTLHGFQITGPEPLVEPTSYYTKAGPAGDLFQFSSPQQVGVIGLGAGTLSCHTEKNRAFDFYEINPAVVETAKKWFSFLKKCSPDAQFYIGDGRLELQKNTDKKYDLLILDAFSSDAIPLHLLTIEAFTLYRDRLSQNGIMGIHISNRFLDLRWPIAAAAKQLGLQARFRTHTPRKDSIGHRSEWVVLAPPEADLSDLDKNGWKTIEIKPDYRLWSDDYSNMLSVFKL